MYLLILYLPFLSFLNGTLFGRFLGRKGSPLYSCILMGMTFFLSLYILYEVSFCNSPVYIYLNNWIYIDILNVKTLFFFDTLTSLMLLVVTSISFLVHIYSVSYMSEEPHLQRFISLLSLFTFFMIVLVTGSNLLQIFVGWEGVGLVSYLLVNFWFTRGAANRAAMMAFLTNRVGDWGYTLGLLIAVSTLLSLDTNSIFGLAPLLNTNIVTVITLALTIGVMGKSAQLGLHAWLPHAMEGFLNFFLKKKIKDKRALLKLHYMREHPLIVKSTIAILWYFITICYFGKILICGQSAGNKINPLGASETLREDLKKAQAFKHYEEDFLNWFIGFSEGDGCLHITNKGFLEFKITQSSHDAQVLFFIKKTLGFGSVKIQDRANKTHSYVVRDRSNLHKIIQILNGNMRTLHRDKGLFKFISAFNLKYNENISFKKNILTPSLSDSWLSGFTDAEGCFTVSVLKREKYTQVSMRYIISQKGEKKLLDNLALIVKGKTSFLKSYDGYNMTVNYKALPLIFTYFKKFPLKTKKLISLKRFISIFLLHKNTLFINRDKVFYDKIEKMSKNVNSLNKI